MIRAIDSLINSSFLSTGDDQAPGYLFKDLQENVKSGFFVENAKRAYKWDANPWPVLKCAVCRILGID